MPRFHHSLKEIADSGTIVIERESADHVEVFYVPTKTGVDWNGKTFRMATPRDA